MADFSSNHKNETQQYWNRKAPVEFTREEYDPRKKIHTDLLWREIRRAIFNRSNLKILDAGAGPGRFSIPLAIEGHSLVHIDISPEMIEIAKERLPSDQSCDITFIEQSICEPLSFPDNYFDVVLCLDSPLSYCVNNFRESLEELKRVAKDSIILCVVNKFGAMMEDGAEFDFEFYGKLKTQWDLFRTGNLIVDDEMKQFLPNLMPSWHAFTPQEIRELSRQLNLKIQRLSAPGTFTRCMITEVLNKVYQNDEAYQDFLDFLELFESEESVLGVGGIYAGGLLVHLKK